MQKKLKGLTEPVEKLLKEGKDLEQISTQLNLPKEEVRLFLHRSRKFRVRKKDNLVIRLLSELIVHPEYFQPTEKFYREVGIGQRRWWQLYKGDKKITEIEYRALCNHLHVDSKVAMSVRQLDIFENNVL